MNFGKKVPYFPSAALRTHYRLPGWGGWVEERIAEKKFTNVAIILGGRGPGKVSIGIGVEVGWWW